MHDHEIELALGLMRAHELAQLARVAPGLHALVWHVELFHEAFDLLEMLELFARQPRKRHAQGTVFRVRENERHGGGRGFLLAVGVVDEQRRQILERRFHPGARRRRLEDRPVRRPRNSRGRGRLTLFAHVAVSGADWATSTASICLAASSALAGRLAASLAMSVSISG